MAASVRLTRMINRFIYKPTLKYPNIQKITAHKIHNNNSIRKVTTAVASDVYDDWESVSNIRDPCYECVDLSFENTAEAYKSKTNFELVRALLVFNLCSVKPLVNHNKRLLKVSRKVLGKNLFEKVMKGTFYGQFVAGEDSERICPVVAKYRLYGVKSILDYSVEKDLSREEAQKAEMDSCISDVQPDNLPDSGPDIRYHAHEEFGDRRDKVISARTYFYEDENHCDENMEHFLQSIDAVSGATNSTGFAAVKLTALGRPQLLLQLSEVLSRVRRFYDVLASADGSGTVSQKSFERYLKSFSLPRDERNKWFTILDSTSQDGAIDVLDWNNLLEVSMDLANVLRVPNLQTGKFESLATGWTIEEKNQMKNMLHRIDQTIKHAKSKDVRVMIDAEQTYFQVAINRLCMEMMRKYNTEKAIVFNTYQCYLKEAFNLITTDLALSERDNFYFGAKLVRGAYMEQERERAITLGYEDPINPNFEATTAMYEQVLCEVLQRVKQRPKGHIAVMVASHNEDTVRYTVQKMKEYGIKASDRVICFGQLLGMCDQVSFSLGQSGYSVYKYVPYGPVEEVLPYLSRRAQENKGVLQKVKREKRLLWSELKRRLKNGQFNYTPPEPLTVPDVGQPMKTKA